MSATERDHQLAAAHLLADGQTHTKAELDALAELLAQVRLEERAAVVAFLRKDVDDDAALLEADALERAEHLSDDDGQLNRRMAALADVARGMGEDTSTWAARVGLAPPHAGECALCRAPFVRGEDGAVASCGCHETNDKTANP